jgi:dihydrofolate synthase/folylpolyglutamate synthase
MDVLGDTLPLIAAEKAGIIKEGRPVVSNVKDKEAARVIEEKAQSLNCDYYDVSETKHENIEINMKGRHQIQNALTALTAIEVLCKDDIKIEKDGLYRGLSKASHIGRFEILKENPYVVIDGAHNEEGAIELVNTVKENYPGKKALMITGMLKDKEVDKMLGHFYEIADDFIATEPNNPRMLPKESMTKKIRAAGKNCIDALTPASSCEKASMLEEEYDVIIFAGSLYLLSDIRGYYI